MAYFFKHPKHTENKSEFIGNDHHEALSSLQDEYSFDLDEIFNLTFDGFVVEKPWSSAV